MMRKQYTAAFKARVAQGFLKEEKTLAQIAMEYEADPTQLKNWRAVALEGLQASLRNRTVRGPYKPLTKDAGRPLECESFQFV